MAQLIKSTYHLYMAHFCDFFFYGVQFSERKRCFLLEGKMEQQIILLDHYDMI